MFYSFEKSTEILLNLQKELEKTEFFINKQITANKKLFFDIFNILLKNTNFINKKLKYLKLLNLYTLKLQEKQQEKFVIKKLIKKSNNLKNIKKIIILLLEIQEIQLIINLLIKNKEFSLLQEFINEIDEKLKEINKINSFSLKIDLISKIANTLIFYKTTTSEFYYSEFNTIVDTLSVTSSINTIDNINNLINNNTSNININNTTITTSNTNTTTTNATTNPTTTKIESNDSFKLKITHILKGLNDNKNITILISNYKTGIKNNILQLLKVFVNVINIQNFFSKSGQPNSQNQYFNDLGICLIDLLKIIDKISFVNSVIVDILLEKNEDLSEYFDDSKGLVNQTMQTLNEMLDFIHQKLSHQLTIDEVSNFDQQNFLLCFEILW